MGEAPILPYSVYMEIRSALQDSAMLRHDVPVWRGIRVFTAEYTKKAKGF
jgi:hypothetical protein